MNSLYIVVLMLLLPVFHSNASQSLLSELNIKTVGLDRAQVKELNKVFKAIQSIAPGKLAIPQTTYQHYSRFKKLFGFSLKGDKLLQWLSKRIKKFIYYNNWAAAFNRGDGNILVGNEFFKRSTLMEQIYILVHEARHSDSRRFSHIQCPENYNFISVSRPDYILTEGPVCDNISDGAYMFQAALLYEFLAFGLFDAKEAGDLYNSSLSRIIPELYRASKPDEINIQKKDVREYIKQNEIIQKLNQYENLQFIKMWQSTQAIAYSSHQASRYVIIIYRNRQEAKSSYLEKKRSNFPLYVIGSVLILCPNGDKYRIFQKVKIIFRSMNFQVAD